MFNNFAFFDFGVPEIVILLIGLALFIFEIAMFIHAIRNKYITTNVRILWLLGMVFIHFFVAVAYYLTDYKKAA